MQMDQSIDGLVACCSAHEDLDRRQEIVSLVDVVVSGLDYRRHELVIEFPNIVIYSFTNRKLLRNIDR
jgi:hypothetical protein